METVQHWSCCYGQSDRNLSYILWSVCFCDEPSLSVHQIVFVLTVNTVFSPYLKGWGQGRWGTWVLCTESHVGKTPSSFLPLPHCLSLSQRLWVYPAVTKYFQESSVLLSSFILSSTMSSHTILLLQSYNYHISYIHL